MKRPCLGLLEESGEKVVDFLGPHLDPSVKGKQNTLVFLPPPVLLEDAPFILPKWEGSSGSCKMIPIL